MAPGTADKRFLTKSAKTASAGGILLALAVAASLLAGCGGGSSDSSSSSTVASGAATGEAAAGSASAAPTGSAAGAPAARNATGASGSEVSGEQPPPGGKHGPRVPQPSGEPAPKITPKERREAVVADLTLQSPSSLPSGGGPPALPARYTCDGNNTSPALRWQGVPQGTAELVLYAMNLRPVEGKLFVDWAVAGLSPRLEELEAGKLPRGAVVGRNSFGKTGYEICPEGESETYIFGLFALPKKLSPTQGFDPIALRSAVRASSRNVGILALTHTRG